MRGLFLSSRVARRTFWILLAAALLPLGLFGTLGWQALADREQAQQRRAETEHLKYVGLRVFDRLAAARAVLAAHAAGTDAGAVRPGDPAVLALLQSVAHVHPDGRVDGDATLTGGWRPDRGRALWWTAPAPGGPVRLVIAKAGPRPGEWWLAEVAPAFLWHDFGADGAAAGVCVRTADQVPLHCDAAPVATGLPSWRLFMHAGFGSPDWVFEGRPPVVRAGGDWPVGRLLALGSLATLLLISILALVTVRRTMVPLERLAEGTRRLAAGDWSARVALRADDEFGQLAESFDRMAARIGSQVQALEVQAAIDRDMLQGSALDAALARVAARLEVVFPHARAAVLACDPADDRWRLYGAHAAVPLPAGDADLRQRLQAGQPADVAQALGLASRSPGVLHLPVPGGEAGDASLLLAAPVPVVAEGPARRELDVLRDRVAVTLAAAQRDHRLRHRAAHDELTGLLNRHGLNDACDALLPGPLGLLYLDLDGFKEVNDALGHSQGDELLRAVARRLADNLPGVRLARPGGDEFVLVAPGGAASAERLAAQVCVLLAQPFMLRGQLVHVGVSVGLALAPDDGSDRETLQRRADLAMYAAKAQGRGRWRRFDPALDHEATERAWLQRDLRAALDARGLTLHYQPRLDLAGGRVPSVEALVRWPHPERGWISPGRFVPVAEESDLILALGDFVLDEALRQQARWRRAGVPLGRVAVNVSARQLRRPGFADQVLERVAHHGLQPRDLELELTESLFAGEAQAVARALEPLRVRGVIVALDDFGTGYSSLSALQQLPVDVLKIDRSFVVGLGEQPGAEAIVRSIVALARALGKRVVAEGVETQRQEALLLQLGCDEFQGYRYARPMPGEAVAAHLAAGAAEPAEA